MKVSLTGGDDGDDVVLRGDGYSNEDFDIDRINSGDDEEK